MWGQNISSVAFWRCQDTFVVRTCTVLISCVGPITNHLALNQPSSSLIALKSYVIFSFLFKSSLSRAFSTCLASDLYFRTSQSTARFTRINSKKIVFDCGWTPNDCTSHEVCVLKRSSTILRMRHSSIIQSIPVSSNSKYEVTAPN